LLFTLEFAYFIELSFGSFSFSTPTAAIGVVRGVLPPTFGSALPFILFYVFVASALGVVFA
jgi:hypothetical protein